MGTLTGFATRRLRFLSTLVIAGALSAGAWCLAAYAQNASEFSYVFPGVKSDTDIVIGNINNQSAAVTAAFYRTTGTVSSTTVLLEPGRQLRLNSATAGVADFDGSVVITSAVALSVSANVASGEAPFDAITPAEPSTLLVIPFAPVTQSAAVDLSVFNPGTEQAEVRVITVAPDGTQGVQTTRLEPKHTTSVSLSGGGSSHVLIRTSGWFRGDRPVAARAVVRDYDPPSPGAVRRTDFAIVPAIPVSQATAQTALPYFVHGEEYFSIVQVVNLSDTRQTITLTARRRDGTPVAGTRNPAVIEDLPAFGARVQSFADLFGAAVTELTEGAITVEGTGPLQAAVAIGHIATPSFTVLAADNRALRTFSYPMRRTGREFFNGLSFWNRSGEDAHVTLSFLLDDGTAVSSVPFDVPRLQQLTSSLAELFPEAQGNGYLFVSSDIPLVSAGIEGRADSTALAGRRPLFAAADFSVPPLTRFLAVGTVRDQAKGVPNVAIRLDGPVQSTTLTDEAGVFVFRDLPQGTYRLTPIPISYVISPLERSFSITNTNSRKNDFTIGLTAPHIDRITPDGVAVNAASTVLTVEGRGFIQGNVVVFEVTELPTTFVSDTILTAVIDRALLAASGEVPIVVRNRGPSGSYVDSAAVTFTVGNPPPALTSVTGQPSPLIAGSILLPFSITVTGSGFNPASQVYVDRSGRQTTFVSQTELRATILPADVATPGFVPITVRNPGAVASSPFQLAVLYPVPVVTAITPATLTALVALDAQAVRITVDGSGFVQDSVNASVTAVVLLDKQTVPTEFVSPTRLVGVVPASMLSSAGIKYVSVNNPPPILGTSNAIGLFVSNPTPVINTVAAGPLTYNPAQSGETIWVGVAVNGSNFSADSTAWISLPCDTLGFRRAQTTQRVSATQLVATVPIRCAGAYLLQVRTPQPGGGASNTVSFDVAGLTSSAAPASAESPAAHVFPLFTVGSASGVRYIPTLRLMPEAASPTLTQCLLTQRQSSASLVGVGGDFYSADVFDAGDSPPALTSITLDRYRPWEVMRANSSGALQSGYATLSCSEAMHPEMLLSVSDASGATIMETSVRPAAAGRSFQLLIDRRDGTRLGFALINESGLEGNYTLIARNELNQEVDRAVYAIAPRSQVARFVDDVLVLPANFVGSIEIVGIEGAPTYAIGARYSGSVFSLVTPVSRAEPLRF